MLTDEEVLSLKKTLIRDNTQASEIRFTSRLCVGCYSPISCIAKVKIDEINKDEIHTVKTPQLEIWPPYDFRILAIAEDRLYFTMQPPGAATPSETVYSVKVKEDRTFNMPAPGGAQASEIISVKLI